MTGSLPLPRPVTQTIALPVDRAAQLLPHAERRGITVGQLALRIVEMCVDEAMIDAVLDDGAGA
ncbi:hypothetical protein [Stakelama tenebrarum]|uniref:hypothetical protein n=1 Tax=Stakelama tenebrarum TaxID=2711215 RepID=UPI001D19485F|nr:hypothetical protein [Sphingosinithalassobacter tenebrarum]